jgi:hypothetical protein
LYNVPERGADDKPASLGYFIRSQAHVEEEHLMKAYLDTVIVSGLVRCDLRQHEMAASRELVERADRGELELVT